ncbi:MAG: ATP-binding cassette domain-containing protein [Bdellovibrionota bacterium]
MIEVAELTKFYGERKILHALNFSVGSKRVCGFLGPNGSGKSTTMDILAGLLGPSGGTARVCGFDVVTQSKDVKACVGYLPDNPPLHKEMIVQEFVEYVAKLHGLKNPIRKKWVENIIEECDVGDVAHRLIGNLSKGYRQRVSLCAALVHKPQVLILDEPTEGLDPNQILHIRNLIKKLASERTVIMSSHILSEVQATCDEVVIINHGHIATKMSLEKNPNHTSYIYSFASNLEGALSWFQQNNFIASAKPYTQRENALSVEFTKEFLQENNLNDGLSKVTNQIVAQNLPLIGIEEKKDGLEEIFFEVIRTQPNAVI